MPVRLIFTVIAALLLRATGECADTPLYFESPEKAVPVITGLLKKQDWKTLSRYYDLVGSEVKRSDLESGEYFLRREKSVRPDPMGFSKYKHPFAPGFRFDHVEATSDPDVTRVVVSIEIDQGGGLKQRVLASFLLRKSAAGFQILPPKKETPANEQSHEKLNLSTPKVLRNGILSDSDVLRISWREAG